MRRVSARQLVPISLLVCLFLQQQASVVATNCVEMYNNCTRLCDQNLEDCTRCNETECPNPYQDCINRSNNCMNWCFWEYHKCEDCQGNSDSHPDCDIYLVGI